MLPLRKELFWDIDVDKIDVEKNKRLIIERVLSLGTVDEFRFLLQTYDHHTLISTIRELAYLDPKTMSFVISFFKINKEQLKCYTKKQSAPQHWS